MKEQKEFYMKKIVILFAIFLFIISSCAILPFLSSNTKSATMKDSYDFVNEIADDGNYNNADIIIEPWTNDPALQLASWGDSSNMLLDMGAVSIEDAQNMSLSQGTTGYDGWDAWPIEKDHVYTFLNRAEDRVYMLIKNVDMSTYTNDYNTEISFDYLIVK